MDKSKYCSECGESISVNAEICPQCGVRQRAGVEMKFCSSCGESILKQAEICPKCGVRQESSSDNVSAAPNKEQRKGKNPEVKIELAKEGCKTITVECPKKIKLTLLQSFLELRFGIPPLNVKPIDKKGLGIILGAFVCIFIGSINLNPFGFFVGIGMIVFNLIITKNYYKNFIQLKLKEGYEPVGEENKRILEEAGIIPIPSEDYFKKQKIYVLVFAGVMLLSFILSFVFKGNSYSRLEKKAKTKLSIIMQEQLYTDVNCEKVTITEEISNDFYRAIAILDTGVEIKITIKKLKNGDIKVVVIPNQ